MRRLTRIIRSIFKFRMDAISSPTKILKEDVMDEDVNFSEKISRLELLKYCQQQYEPYLMVKRLFRQNIVSGQINGVSEGCHEYLSNPNTLRVFQWNLLAQSLGQSNDNFIKCPEIALTWKYRRFQLIEEIIKYCPDIICLQEVDHFKFLKHTLGTQGYKGIFFPKPDSPCIYIEGNNGPDGCAIFYRKKKFALIKNFVKILEIWRIKTNQVAILLILQIQETDQQVCIATTHLKARTGAILATLRNEQGKDLLEFVSSQSKGKPVILCGDFNAEPSEAIYKSIVNSQMNLSSAYADCQPKGEHRAEPKYTTWKVREEGEICHTIDYVFYSKDKLVVDNVLNFPSGEQIGIDRVPSHRYPSDHFSLVCDFKLLL